MHIRPRSGSNKPQIHYHYHYYPHQNRDHPLTERQKLYTSHIYHQMQQSQHSTPKQNQNQRMRTEDNRSMTDSYDQSKMRMSEVIHEGNFPSYGSTQQYRLTDIKARSVVEEEIVVEEDSETPPVNSFHEKLSRVTKAETYSEQSRLIAYYESELDKQKKQIERLKMVEEECNYLRLAFYNHYTDSCHK